MFHLPPDVKKLMDETYHQQLKKPIKALELPCTQNHAWKEPVIVEITEPRDQVLTCPKCGKKHYLVWSKLQDNLKFR